MPLSRSKAIEELQRRSKKIPDHIDILAQINFFASITNSGLEPPGVLISLILTNTGLLEYALAEAIASRLSISKQPIKSKIFEGDHEREGIIGTLYTRNVLAHALDLYGEHTYNDVNTVRIVRNLCAHSKSGVDFNSEELKAICVFHSIGVLESYADPHEKTSPTSAVHALAEFIQQAVPYLLLYTSKDWGEDFIREWRQVFS